MSSGHDADRKRKSDRLSRDLRPQHKKSRVGEADMAASVLSESHTAEPYDFTTCRLLIPECDKSRLDLPGRLERVWADCERTLDAVFAGLPVCFATEQHYREVEQVVRLGFGEELYTRVRAKLELYLVRDARPQLHALAAAGTDDAEVLRAVVAHWDECLPRWQTTMAMFDYLEHAHVRPRRSLRQDALDLFRSLILEDERLEAAIFNGACVLVSRDRTGGVFDGELFRGAVQMFSRVDVYSNRFEPRFLEQSQVFVLQWVDATLASTDLAGYVRATQARIQSEADRGRRFHMAPHTMERVHAMLLEHAVRKQVSRLATPADVHELLSRNAVDELRDLFDLLERVELGARLQKPFQEWADETGTAIVFDQQEPEKMVPKLIRLKQQLDTVWTASFRRNEGLGLVLRTAFEDFINKTSKTAATWNTNNSKPAEMIAKHVDSLLRSGLETHDAEESASMEDEVQRELDHIVDLFRFLWGKDTFEAFYKQDLARRLLMNRVMNQEWEKSMLQRLKTECGENFTAKLETMFNDYTISGDEMREFKSKLEATGSRDDVDFHVHVLSTGSWPAYPDIPIHIPPEIQRMTKRFEEHYQSRHSTRKLVWKHQLGLCRVKARFPKGEKELVVSAHQAVVLVLFNSVKGDGQLSYEEIQAATGLPPRELQRDLQSLACARYRPLTKHPKGRDIRATDVFSVTQGFHDSKVRIRINTVQLKETREENKATHERVAQDRSFETQAAIVRIMKGRKRTTHAELVAETVRVTTNRGRLEISDIKKSIERLIDREFLEREDGGVYTYLA